MIIVERRFTMLPVSVRGDGDRRRIGGYAAVFNKPSRNLGGFIEVVTPSAFNHSRGEGWPDVLARYNHDDNMLLGTTGGHTLDLEVDSEGLQYVVDPPNARQDIVELVSRGDVRKSSFAFRMYAEGDTWGLSEQNYPQRSLVSVQLVDVAPVNQPAYEDTSAGTRSDGALHSLARFAEVAIDEVRALSNNNDLMRFFVRTDNIGPKPKPKPKPMLGAKAAALILARKQDPCADPNME